MEDVGPAAHLRDLLALQDHLDFEQIALRVHGSAQLAIRYAAIHPQRVSSLILSSPSVTNGDPDRAPSVAQQLLSIAAGADLRLFARLVAVSLAGWYGPDTTWFAKLLETGTDPDDFFRTMAAMSGDDITDLVPTVRCPVLIIQRREPPNYFFDDIEQHLGDSRTLARNLPAARLVILEGSSMMITTDPASTSALLDFLRDVAPADQNPARTQDATPIRTIMFTDLEGHTEMMQRLGDAKGRDVLREHEAVLALAAQRERRLAAPA